MGVAVLRAAVDTIQRPVAVDITRVAVAAGVPVAEVVDTPAVAVAIRVVAAIPAAEVVDTPVAAIPVAEAIAKKLGDSMSPREAAT
jgi:type IV secretory pathway VirB3-like protein